jgi:cobalt-zinc-cadmium efflux system outer membrane protein
VWLGAGLACASGDPPLDPAGLRAQVGRREPTETQARSQAPPLVLPPGVALADGLSPQEAAALALWNNAAFEEKLAQLGFARADLAQARMLANPALWAVFPVGGKQLEYALSLPLETLWMLPLRVALARLEGQRTSERLLAAGLDLIRDVRVAGADLEAADQRTRIAGDLSDTSARLAEIAAGRLSIGDLSQGEAEAARIESVRVRADLARARTDAQSARRRWEVLLGIAGRANADPAALAEDELFCASDGDPDALLERSLALRPELREAQLAIAAAEERASLARAEIFTASGILDANGSGSSREVGPGISLVLPILSQNQGGRARARAELSRAQAAERATAERIASDLRDAHARHAQIAQEHQTWKDEVVAPLAEAAARADRRFQLGEIAPPEQLVARRDLDLARLRESDLRAAEARSCAELDRSAGVGFLEPGAAGATARSASAR